MILSYRHRFTFLHSPKSAGSSIKMCLAPHLGPRDILLGARTERVEANVRPNLRARLDAARNLTPTGMLAAVGLRSHQKLIGQQQKAYARHFGLSVDHPSAERLRDFDRRAWERHFKFSFVRNPYERTVSMYLFLTRDLLEERPSLGAFIGRLLDDGGQYARWRNLLDQWPIYAIGDHVAVDYVGRHETFDHDVTVVCGEIGLPWRPERRAKAAPAYDFRSFYDETTRKVVRRLCEREIDHFGYSF